MPSQYNLTRSHRVVRPSSEPITRCEKNENDGAGKSYKFKVSLKLHHVKANNRFPTAAW